jgi:hypothetical protein
MTRKGWIVAAGALDLAVLVATSAPHFEASDSAEPVEIELSAEQPTLFIRGEVSGGSAVEYLTLSLSFDGFNAASSSGRVTLVEVPLEDEEIPDNPIELGSAVIEARAGQPQPVIFTLDQGISRSVFGPFQMALQLEGEAELLGELTVSAHASASEDDPGLTVSLGQVEVRQ